MKSKIICRICVAECLSKGERSLVESRIFLLNTRYVYVSVYMGVYAVGGGVFDYISIQNPVLNGKKIV